MKEKFGTAEPNRIAIVGGGVGGLTAAACLLSVFENAKIFIFERRWDLCALQQGADHRWLHPHIYSWPQIGSKRPGAGLPLLNWEAGRASDVVRGILHEFRNCVAGFGAKRVNVRLGVEHLKIQTEKNEIEWVGHNTHQVNGFYAVDSSCGMTESFDEIVVAVGFGLEIGASNFPTPSYWRSEQHSQPILNGVKQSYLVSGYGDGALVDLCRLTVERFRQDTILHEIFETEIEKVEEVFRNQNAAQFQGRALFDYFVNCSFLSEALAALKLRIRKDTRVFLHLGGVDGANRDFYSAFRGRSSFLNRLMLYLLYRCGAFSPTFGDLLTPIQTFALSPQNVICRHGARTGKHLSEIFSDSMWLKYKMRSMGNAAAQTAELQFPPGFFRSYREKK